MLRHGGSTFGGNPAEHQVLIIIVPVSSPGLNGPGRNRGMKIDGEGKLASPLQPEIEFPLLMGVKTAGNPLLFPEGDGFIPEGKLHIRHMIDCLKPHAALKPFFGSHIRLSRKSIFITPYSSLKLNDTGMK
jgi:hypothetical protein